MSVWSPEHFSHLDVDPHEVALWVLLKRTRSDSLDVRLHAVQELAENHHWHGQHGTVLILKGILVSQIT